MIFKKETILVGRDTEGRMIAAINRLEGEQKYEIYTTEVADIDEVLSLVNKEYNKPLKKEDISIVDGKIKIKGAKESGYVLKPTIMECGCLNCNFECDYWSKKQSNEI